jgi:YD repeat-containing protein
VTHPAKLYGKGAKVGLYKKYAADLGLKMTGLAANLLSIIDNLVNGEYYLPPGDKEELYALVREVAGSYTIVGTTYQYNAKNQLMLRHNLVRDEEHKYTYDARGNMISNGRTKFYWNDDNQLIQAVFPDGEGVR